MKNEELIINYSFLTINYFTIIPINLTKIKSNPPRNNPTIKLIIMTTNVKRIVSCRVGHTTFLSSSRVSRKKETGIAINKKSKIKNQNSKVQFKSKKFIKF